MNKWDLNPVSIELDNNIRWNQESGSLNSMRRSNFQNHILPQMVFVCVTCKPNLELVQIYLNFSLVRSNLGGTAGWKEVKAQHNLFVAIIHILLSRCQCNKCQQSLSLAIGEHDFWKSQGWMAPSPQKINAAFSQAREARTEQGLHLWGKGAPERQPQVGRLLSSPWMFALSVVLIK